MRQLYHGLRQPLSRFPLLLTGILCTALIASCAVGPDYRSQQAPEDSGYTADPMPAETAAAPVALGESQHFVSTSIDAEWWKRFGSAKLDALIERALLSSPSMDAARATLEQAEQTYQAQGGATQYPQVSANTGGSRQRVNTAAFGQPGGGSKTFSLFNAGVSAGYSLDLFGGNRRMLESFAAEADYQRYQMETARLLLVTNVITTAVMQAQLATQLQINEQILLAREEQLEITGKRLALGAGSRSEVLALQTTVEQTRAAIPQLRNGLEQTQHLLAVLAGLPPATAETPSFVLTDFTLPARLPVVIPSELVRQRPDIRASEALMQAANARYGVTISKRYPQINLSADIGSQALTASTLFGAGTLVWGAAGQLAQPLFHMGLPAESRAAKAGLDVAEANYRQTVLHALQNVADTLRSLDHDASTLAARAAANSAAQSSLELVKQEYNLGAANYLEVLSAEQQMQLNALNLVEAQSRRLIDTAALYQAMGGGALFSGHANLDSGDLHTTDTN
ncbi:MAG: efflux transporter outer membrane subunit [Mariprofundaceae bacterium]|nr:efflux transporter outer membrane subunit [Mariprofundaceae bacterium]